jgi:hypothetical protein
MTQQELDSAVACATGEDVCEISRRGFSIADPLEVDFDPEPYEPVDEIDKYIDWDGLDAERNAGVIPVPRTSTRWAA